MIIVCPCLNVKINCNQIYSDTDYVSFVDLIKNETEFYYDTSKCIILIDNGDSGADDDGINKCLNIEYKQLIGYIKRANYCIFKCCSCNIYTHILFDHSNKLIISSNMLIKNNKNELESMKNDENYSKIFNIIINKNHILTTTDILKTKDIKTNIDDINEYKSLSKHIENVASSYLNNEKEKYLSQIEEYKLEKENTFNYLKTKINNEINQFNKIIKNISSSFNSSASTGSMMMMNAALNSTQTTTTTTSTNNSTINTAAGGSGINENTTSQESIESGYIEDNSNSSIISDISTASIHNTNATSTTTITNNNSNSINNGINRIRTWSENNKNEMNKRSKALINQNLNNNNNNNDDDNHVFCFEDNDDINYSSNQSDYNNYIDDDDDAANDGDLINHHHQQQQSRFNNRINNNESMDFQNKYSCSCPRTIPTMSLRSRNIQDYDFIDDEQQTDRNSRQQPQLEQEQRSNDDNDNLGRAFAQLASSIVQKDGTELFGDRPSRRIPINSISKSCYDS